VNFKKLNFLYFPSDFITLDILISEQCLGPLVYVLPNNLKLFLFLIFWLWAYPERAIPETRSAHVVRYQRFHYINIMQNDNCYFFPLRTGNYCLSEA